MELYIQIRNGKPFDHPILDSNFKGAFPHIDTNNLPPEFARFERVTVPQDKKYEVYQETTYEWLGDIVTDVHHFRPMNDEERLAVDEQEAKEKERAIAS
jgi:hypothetical protein